MSLKKWYANLPIEIQCDLDRLCAVCQKSCDNNKRGCLLKWNVYQFSKTKRACRFVERYRNKIESKENKDGNY